MAMVAFFSEFGDLGRANNNGAVVIEEENGVYGSHFEAADLQRTVHR